MTQTKVLIFVPTIHYGGLDILFSSLKRQTYSYTLCMADELASKRAHIYEKYAMFSNAIFVDCDKKPGNVRALASAYNNAADLCVDMDFDLMITLQDYIWIPDNGIELFVEDYANYKNSLITGLVSLSFDSGRDESINPYGLFSIYEKPLIERPEPITWYDSRDVALYPGEPMLRECLPEHWEANWAAIPATIFHEGIRWDIEYDKGIAYENMDFAKTVEKELGYSCILDKRNHAIGIEHRKIWPQEEKDLKRYNNRYFHEEKWGLNI